MGGRGKQEQRAELVENNQMDNGRQYLAIIFSYSVVQFYFKTIQR